MLIKRDFIKNM